MALGQKRCCYLLATAAGFQKIGLTKHLGRRLSNLQTGSAQQLTVKSIIASNRPDCLEKYLHHRFAAYRHGGEWFKLPPTELNQWHSRGFADFNTHGQLTLASTWIKSLLSNNNNSVAEKQLDSSLIVC